MLADSVHRFLDDHLEPKAGLIAVAYSGGGDSTALLHTVCLWAEQHGRKRVLALIVDHALRAGSADEATTAAKRAQTMGAEAHVLTWAGSKPSTAIQENARKARYALMGDACRADGITTLLLGHSRDDQIETVMMRLEGNSGWRGLTGMAGRAHAPLWPALYGIDVLRPMLGQSRADIRTYNKANGLAYVDDPSNEDATYTRVAVRQYLAQNTDLAAKLERVSASAKAHLDAENDHVTDILNTHVSPLSWGGLRVDAVQSTDVFTQAMRKIIQCASGTSVRPPTEKTQTLIQHITKPGFRGATLGGAMIIPSDTDVIVGRDPGAILGRGGTHALEVMHINGGDQVIWDGRFFIKAKADVQISAVGLQAVTSKAAQYKKLTIPEPFRRSQPCFKIKGDTDGFRHVSDPKVRAALTISSIVEGRLAQS